MDRTSLEADTYWVATVVMASGPLLLLRYDGYDDDRSGDFWCDAASDDLQPVGWCARNNHILIPPAAMTGTATEMANETVYERVTETSTASPTARVTETLTGMVIVTVKEISRMMTTVAAME